MRSRLGNLFAGAVAAVVLASTATIFATSYTLNGVTLTVPSYSVANPLFHCEPQEDPTANRIRLEGVPAGSTVRVNYIFSNGTGGNISQVGQVYSNQSGTQEYPIPYPEDTTSWPIQDGDTRAIVVNVQVAVQAPNATAIKFTKVAPWKIVCTPDNPGDFQGCTPGYWRQDHHFDSWVGYEPTDSFDTAFGVVSTLDPPGPGDVLTNPTLLDAVWIGGGGQNAMARHAVAALLNASNPDVHYPLSVGQVVAAVQNAYATGDFSTAHQMFEGYNEIGCPLN